MGEEEKGPNKETACPKTPGSEQAGVVWGSGQSVKPEGRCDEVGRKEMEPEAWRSQVSTTLTSSWKILNKVLAYLDFIVERPSEVVWQMDWGGWSMDGEAS